MRAWRVSADSFGARGRKLPGRGAKAPPELESRLRELAEDTLRGPTLASVPFFDRRAVIRFLDDEPNVPPEQRAFYFPSWITMLNICALHERHGM